MNNDESLRQEWIFMSRLVILIIKLEQFYVTSFWYFSTVQQISVSVDFFGPQQVTKEI
jgi:hypothetical protein